MQILFDGTLLIENFTRGDSGKYQCKATNDMGIIESKLINVNFHEPKIVNNEGEPTIVLPPMNLSVIPHERIILHCVTIGELRSFLIYNNTNNKKKESHLLPCLCCYIFMFLNLNNFSFPYIFSTHFQFLCEAFFSI